GEPQGRDARVGVQAFEITDLALAEDQDAPGFEVFVESGQREAGLLNVRTRDDAGKPVGACQQLERQAEGFRSAREQRRDRDAGGRHLFVDYASVSTSVNSPFARRYNTLRVCVSVSRKTTTS